MLHDITVNFFFQFILIFGRFWAMASFLPSIGDASVPRNIRVVISLVIAFTIYPLLHDMMPNYNGLLSILAASLICEMIIGYFIGFVAKIIFSVLYTVGLFVAMQSGLGSAAFFDPAQKEQSSIFSNILTNIVATGIFITDTHHIFIESAIESYKRFPPCTMPDMGDVSSFLSSVMNNASILGFQIMAPFLIISTSMLVGSGILARLIPSLQVFFILTPVQIIAAYATLFITFQILIDKIILEIQHAAKFMLG